MTWKLAAYSLNLLVNPVISMKAKALAVAGGKEPAAENWDYSVKPITGNELSTTGEMMGRREKCEGRERESVRERDREGRGKDRECEGRGKERRGKGTRVTLC